MIEEELLHEMRLQNAILRAGFRDRIDALGRDVKQDPVAVAIIEVLSENGRMGSGALKQAVTAKVDEGSDVSPRTIIRRLGDLESKGVIWQLGQASSTEYEATGLIQ